jgi:hypothetical protein
MATSVTGGLEEKVEEKLGPFSPMDADRAAAVQPSVSHDDDVTAIQLAHDVDDTQYSPWTKGMFKLYAILLIPYLCGALNGYDGSLMGGLIAMTSYQSVFNM